MTLHRHLGILRRRCAHIRRAIKEVGLPEPRSLDRGFPTIIHIICTQQVSTAAGETIFQRVVQACGGKITPKAILGLQEPGLRGCGLSGPKARYALGAAEAVVAGTLDFDALHAADDDGARAMLTALKGIGNWSADIYLMFAMGRPDVWPVADLALQHGVRLLHGKRARPSLEAMAKAAESWRPYRSGAAILLWRYYGSTLKASRGKKPK